MSDEHHKKMPDSINDILDQDSIKDMLDNFIQSDLAESGFLIVLSRRRNGGFDFYRSEGDTILTEGLLRRALSWWEKRDYEHNNVLEP